MLFWRILCFKIINKLFLIKMSIKWANLVYLVYFLNFFKVLLNLGKFPSQFITLTWVILMLFPRFDKLLTAKNTNATFLSRRKYNFPFWKGLKTWVRIKLLEFFFKHAFDFDSTLSMFTLRFVQIQVIRKAISFCK